MKRILMLMIALALPFSAMADISEEDAFAIAQSTGGKVLSVKKKDGVYVVKVRENGKVRFVVINAETGEIQ